MLTTLSIGTVLAFLLTGLIFGAFTRSENVKGSPISIDFAHNRGQKNIDQADCFLNILGVRKKIQMGT